MELKELSDAIGDARCGDEKSIIFRMSSYNFIELDYALTRKAFDEIVAKLPFVKAGIDVFTAGEKILFQLFCFHAGGGQDAIYGEKKQKAGRNTT